MTPRWKLLDAVDRALESGMTAEEVIVAVDDYLRQHRWRGPIRMREEPDGTWTLEDGGVVIEKGFRTRSECADFAGQYGADRVDEGQEALEEAEAVLDAGRAYIVFANSWKE